MDPKKSKDGSSSSKGRGRGSRFRPRIQSQPVPYIPQMSPQPQYYQPQMTSSPYYQPQYYPQPPTNPSQFPSEFNPFDYRDGTSGRETSVERQLPLYSVDDEEDEIVIPETQPPIGQQENEEEVQEVQEIQEVPRRNPTKAEKKTWTPVEEEALAKAWVHISTCRAVGNEQNRESFWRRIHEHFKQNIRDTTRTHHGLNTKWKSLSLEMGVFNGLWIQQNRLRESGCSDVDVMKNALSDYKTKHAKPFSHIDAWEIVRHEDKWLEHPDIAQGSSSHSDKWRKSSESGHYETASNDNTMIPDLNDDTMPRIPKRKGKKAETESSSKGSVATSFDAYTTKKTQILERRAEQKAAKDEMAEKLMATKIRVMKEKAMFRALKFFQTPHDHITDPNVLAVTLAQKREIAEKYGWHFDF